MKKSHQQQTAKKRLLRALNANLSAIGQSPYARSLGEGKEYICSVCNKPRKACEKDPRAVCHDMIREGTTAWLVEDTLLSSDERTYGRCLFCGSRISSAQLKKNPTAELCAACVRKGERIQARRVARA